MNISVDHAFRWVEYFYREYHIILCKHFLLNIHFNEIIRNGALSVNYRLKESRYWKDLRMNYSVKSKNFTKYLYATSVIFWFRF